jgi:hypothetical protein
MLPQAIYGKANQRSVSGNAAGFFAKHAFSSLVRVDLAKRGCAISLTTLASVRLSCFFDFFRFIPQGDTTTKQLLSLFAHFAHQVQMLRTMKR